MTDTAGIMAHPLETIHQKKTNPFARIADLITQRKVKQIVIGLPLHLDGSEGNATQRVRAFREKLRPYISGLPVHFSDESFTTTIADEKLHKAGIRGKRNAQRKKNIINQAAAVEILNNWLSKQQNSFS